MNSKNAHKAVLASAMSLLFLTACSQTAPTTDAPTSTTPPPQEQAASGPYYHQIYTAESTDGLTWTQANTASLAEHASVPTAGMIGDRLFVYYVDVTVPPEKLGCMYSDDEGATFTKGTCSIQGTPTDRNVDFSFVTDEGVLRLYYYSVDGEIDAEREHSIQYATTTDGFTFTDQGSVFEYAGLVDPDIFYTGTQWVLHCFSIKDMATVVATSEDGTDFSYQGPLALEKIGVTKPVAVDGGFRMYGFKQGEQTKFFSYFSTDGLNWEQEAGVRFEAPADTDITDPFVIQLPDGTYKMFYTASAKPAKN
jgi:hypothetical protein